MHRYIITTERMTSLVPDSSMLARDYKLSFALESLQLGEALAMDQTWLTAEKTRNPDFPKHECSQQRDINLVKVRQLLYAQGK